MTNLPLHQKGIIRNLVWIINLILLRIQKKIPKITQKDLSSKYDIGKATVLTLLSVRMNIEGNLRKISAVMMMTFLSMNSSNIYNRVTRLFHMMI